MINAKLASLVFEISTIVSKMEMTVFEISIIISKMEMTVFENTNCECFGGREVLTVCWNSSERIFGNVFQCLVDSRVLLPAIQAQRFAFS